MVPFFFVACCCCWFRFSPYPGPVYEGNLRILYNVMATSRLCISSILKYLRILFLTSLFFFHFDMHLWNFTDTSNFINITSLDVLCVLLKLSMF